MSKRFLAILLAVLMVTSTMSGILMVSAAGEVYKDSSASVEARVADLLGRMTLDEKIAQCVQGERNQYTPAQAATGVYGSILSGGGSVPSSNTPAGWRTMVDSYQTAMAGTRLGIPVIYGVDAVHGHNNVVNATIFPHNIGLGATRDAELVKKIGRATAEEVASTGIFWDFAPCIGNPQNIRWGRTYEGYGSDLDLCAELGSAYIKGMQGETAADYKNGTAVASTAKHYMGEGYTQNGANQGNFTIDYDSQAFKDMLKPYKAAIEAGALTVMPSFNSINGVKCTGNYYLLTTVLKEQLGFKGFTIGDWDAHKQLSGTLLQQCTTAFNAGLDMFMCQNDCPGVINALKTAYNSGDITLARIDDAVTRILRVKFLLGLFDNKRYSDPATSSLFGSAEHRDIAREAVRKSLVLLKNQGDIVGKLKDMDKIFVAGKTADNIGRQCGGWTISWQGSAGSITQGTTILQGIRNHAKAGATVNYNATGNGSAGNDVAVVVIGENPYAEGNGDAGETALKLDSTDLQCLNNIRSENPTIPIVVVLVSGRPMLIGEQLNNWAGLVAAWLPGTEGDGIGQVLFKDNYDFTGKLSMDWPAYFKGINNAEAPQLFAYGYGLKKGQDVPVVVPEEPPLEALELPGTIKLAEFVNQSGGLQTEGTSDVGGGQNLGYCDAGRWAEYYVNVKKGGLYKMTFRLSVNASAGADQVQLRNAAGQVICTPTTTSTGGWQNWRSFETTGILTEGPQYLRYYLNRSGSNANWIQFEYIGDTVTANAIPGTVEAENYYTSVGAGVTKVDFAGGTYVTGAGNSNWIGLYCSVGEAGRYKVTYKVARQTAAAGGFSLCDAYGSVISTLNLPATGAIDTFQDVYDYVYLNKGDTQLRIRSNTSGWAIDKIVFERSDAIPQGNVKAAGAVKAVVSSQKNPGSAEWFTTQFPVDYTLSQRPALDLCDNSSAYLTPITIDPAVQYQTVKGFGTTLDETSINNLLRMKPEFRAQVLKDLLDPVNGIGLSVFKLTIGSSDFCSKAFYSYDDTDPGKFDFDMKGFSIQKDIDYKVVALLKEILAINPNVTFIAAPWSPPGFMKEAVSDYATGNLSGLKGGYLKSNAIPALAKYYAKYVQAYQDLGIHVSTISLQNEPSVSANYPSCIISAEQEKLLSADLAKELKALSLGTKIYAFDDDFASAATYVSTVLSTPEAFSAVSGIALQDKGGAISNMGTVASTYPSKDLIVTNTTAYGVSRMDKVIQYFQNGATTFVLPTTLLDTKKGPTQTTKTVSPSILIQQNIGTTQVEYDRYDATPEYYLMGQISKYVKAGARRVSTTGGSAGGVNSVAFENPDGQIVIVASNASNAEKYASFKIYDTSFNGIIPAGAVITYTIDNIRSLATGIPAATVNTGKAINATFKNGGAQAGIGTDSILVNLEGATFVQANTGDITLTGSTVLTAKSVTYVDPTHVEIALQSDGTDYQTDIALTVNVPASAIAGGTAALARGITARTALSAKTAAAVPGIIPAQSYGQASGLTNGTTSSKPRVTSGGYGSFGDYKINVAEAGDYTMTLTVSNDVNTFGAVEVQLDGKVLRLFDEPRFWNNWVNIRDTVTLPQGEHVLRVFFAQGSLLLNQINIQKLPAPTAVAATGTTKIEAENFVACDVIGIEATNIGYTNSYNYMDYSINVESTGMHNFDIAYSTTYDNAQLYVEVGDGKYSALVQVANTGAWTSWGHVQFALPVEAGAQRMRIATMGNGINLDYASITRTGPICKTEVLTTPIVVDELFTLRMTTPLGTKKVQLANSNGMPVTLKNITSVTEGDAIIWTAQASVGTAGKERTFTTLMVDAAGNAAVNDTFTVDVLPPTAKIFSAGFTGNPVSTKVNVPTEVTIVTDKNASNVYIKNAANGADMGRTLVSKTVNADTITWKYTIKIGSQGTNRGFYALVGDVKSATFYINVSLI